MTQSSFAPFYVIPQSTVLCGECTYPVQFEALKPQIEASSTTCHCTNYKCRRYQVKFVYPIPMICLKEHS